MFGINGGELTVLIVLAAVLIGPQDLPKHARRLAQAVREARRFLAEAKGRVEQEVGETLPDLSVLDPRQYDPRRIIRDAIFDPPDSSDTTTTKPEHT
ncbi:MAG: hypothetical protein LBU05_02810 [Bifidobacteriaceae bacterium]|jgi:sec-independent protein translocase protein TatB|nr:hypothetical protein [Bifidobacteriaceae bacterium]